MRLKASLEVFNYWNRIRGAQDAPLRSDVDPAAIRHILPQIFILETSSDEDLRFRLAGTMACSLFDRELRGELFSSLWGASHAGAAEATARHSLRNIAPFLIDATGSTRSERKVGFEIALLPMCSAATQCDRLLGCIAPDTAGAWIGSDVLLGLTIDGRYPLRDQSLTDMPEIKEREPSAWTWTRSAAGLEAATRRALHLLGRGGNRSIL